VQDSHALHLFDEVVEMNVLIHFVELCRHVVDGILVHRLEVDPLSPGVIDRIFERRKLPLVPPRARTLERAPAKQLCGLLRVLEEVRKIVVDEAAHPFATLHLAPGVLL